ncbi:MAG: hypothetical protein JNK73_04635 [Bacteroidia bacterium]|nr:hypothetical protein [Bacteroidia bacterium]
MNVFLEKNFIRLYWLLCGIVFVVVALRAFFIPFSHDEASTFFFYVQSDDYLPYKAHVYTNNHVLNSALANICYHLGGSHRFVLRLPNLLSFLLLCWGVYRFFPYLKHYATRVLLITCFILTFNFLDFFQLCRGYGLSMALMVLGFSFLQEYFSNLRFKALVLFSLCIQLALAANLTLLVLVLLLWLLVLAFQLYHKQLTSLKNFVLQGMNLLVLLFWIKFSFFYKEKGVLDSGWGEDYWQVTFKSLMQFVFGSNALWIQVILLFLFLLALSFSIVHFFKRPFRIMAIFEPGVFYTFVFTALVIGIYLQKQILKVNYPEDRTGLYLYVIYALTLVFLFESVPALLSKAVALLFTSTSLVYFVLSYNLESFTHYFYHVIPKAFYTELLKQKALFPEPFTIGGHVNREMNYAFMNYRGGSPLNPMDIAFPMRMNCDYFIAERREKPYYDPFYDELMVDKYWDHVLLKRKHPIQRIQFAKLDSLPRYYSGQEEFLEFLKIQDSSLSSRNSMELEIELFFKKVPSPFKSFLVLSVENANNETVYYSRAQLHWLDDDLNGEKKTLKLTVGPIPEGLNTMKVYIWNIDKHELEVSVHKLNIYELHGAGVNFTIPKEYYPFIEKVTQKPLL